MSDRLGINSPSSSLPLLLPLLLLLLAHLPSTSCETELTVTTILAEGFCMYDENTKRWSGFIPEVVTKLGQLKNFQPKFTEVNDGRYGAFEEKTGTWSGMIGEVMNGTATFAAAALTQTSGREKHIDFSHEILDVGLVAIAKTPKRIHPVYRSAAFFISVFDAGVWICAILVFLVTCLLIFLNHRYNPREQQEAGRATNGEEFGVMGSLFYVVSTGCFQGYKRSPSSIAGRCLSMFWWIFAIIFAATYIAGVLCGLVASRGSLNENFLRLNGNRNFEWSGYTPVWLPAGSTNQMMKDSDLPLFRTLYKLNNKFRKDDASKRLERVRTVADVVALVKSDSQFVGILESDLAYWHVRRSNCELMVISNLLNDKSYAFAFKENSTWRGPINEGILKLRESGFIRDTYRKYFGGPFSSCDGQQNSPSELTALDVAGDELARMFRDSLPISLSTFAGPLLLYLLGLLLSAAAAGLDLFIFTRYERGRHGNQLFSNVASDDAKFSRDTEPVVG